MTSTKKFGSSRVLREARNGWLVSSAWRNAHSSRPTVPILRIAMLLEVLKQVLKVVLNRRPISDRLLSAKKRVKTSQAPRKARIVLGTVEVLRRQIEAAAQRSTERRPLSAGTTSVESDGRPRSAQRPNAVRVSALSASATFDAFGSPRGEQKSSARVGLASAWLASRASTNPHPSSTIAWQRTTGEIEIEVFIGIEERQNVAVVLAGSFPLQAPNRRRSAQRQSWRCQNRSKPPESSRTNSVTAPNRQRILIGQQNRPDGTSVADLGMCSANAMHQRRGGFC